MSSPNSVGPKVEPVVGALRIGAGKRLQDAAPCAVTLAPPPQAPRARSGERLFILLDVTGPVSSHLYRELREVVTQTYWSSTGSITAALRQAAAAASRRLFQANLHATPADRCYGGLVCAVLRDEDLFILQAGPAGACFFHEGRLKRFSRDEQLAPLGTGRLADVRLHHTYVAPGDKLLLASPALARAIGDVGLARVLARVGAEEVVEGLEQVGGGADLAALVACWPLPGEAPAVREPPAEDSVKPRALPLQRPRREMGRAREASAERGIPRLFSRLRTPSRPDGAEAAPIPVEPPIRAVEPSRPYVPPPPEFLVEEQVPVEHERLPTPSRREPPREPGPDLGERVEDVARSAGRGLVTAGGLLADGTGTLFRRMLPGPEREARRRTRSARPARPPRSRVPRPVPQENRTAMMVVAIGIPIVLAVTVILAYRSLGADARFSGLVKQAEEEVALAQAAGNTEFSRPHWEAALEHAKAAIELRPGDQVAGALRGQAQAALDALDGIVRLQPILLTDFGPGTVPRRLVIHGQMMFVLDPAGGWVSRLTLNQAGDGVIEPEDMPIVRQGQSIGEGVVGDLVDLVWVDLASGRQTSGLLILEQDGALISYDPAWEGEGGTLQLQRSYLGTPPGSPKVVGTYDGRFYVLDAAINQIRRYEPYGDTYPERPDYYFVTGPPRLLNDVLDMAIDGYIYLLHADGAILKYLGGNPEDFDVRGVPGGFGDVVALAVDLDSGSGVVYVADRGSGRVVVLGPDGEFQKQFHAGDAFDALEALAVDEIARRMVVISGGRLYVASLP